MKRNDCILAHKPTLIHVILRIKCYFTFLLQSLLITRMLHGKIVCRPNNILPETFHTIFCIVINVTIIMNTSLYCYTCLCRLIWAERERDWVLGAHWMNLNESLYDLWASHKNLSLSLLSMGSLFIRFTHILKCACVLWILSHYFWRIAMFRHQPF